MPREPDHDMRCPGCGALFVLVGRRHRCAADFRDLVEKLNAPKRGAADFRDPVEKLNTPAPAPKRRRQGSDPSTPKVPTLRPKPVAPAPAPSPKLPAQPDKVAFDKLSYQREYMRKRRAAKRGASPKL